METWKERICAKSYGFDSQKLADEIATLATSQLSGNRNNSPSMDTYSTSMQTYISHSRNQTTALGQ